MRIIQLEASFRKISFKTDVLAAAPCIKDMVTANEIMYIWGCSPVGNQTSG